MSELSARFCPQCENPFRCGMNDEGGCWCARDFPALPDMPVPEHDGCLCPSCLTQRAAVILGES